MLENIPTQSTMTELLGQPLFEIWQELCSVIEEKYDMEIILLSLIQCRGIIKKCAFAV